MLCELLLQPRPARARLHARREGDRVLSALLSEEDYLRHADELTSYHRALFHEEYLSRVRAAAEDLVGARYLLAEDVDLVVRLCGERYDAVVERERVTA